MRRWLLMSVTLFSAAATALPAEARGFKIRISRTSVPSVTMKAAPPATTMKAVTPTAAAAPNRTIVIPITVRPPRGSNSDVGSASSEAGATEAPGGRDQVFRAGNRPFVNRDDHNIAAPAMVTPVFAPAVAGIPVPEWDDNSRRPSAPSFQRLN